ncbi:hypothetical protein GPECTOR_144g722 [Gonium pectorale]|uniref:Reverse transcriptase RNase H-like domain-containing protein n=1 Tax=Gonium pectorale TaxID=33097 RepID=A0A150FXY1_GONPE|nr:hypothetical protein GPECTOR_144g722 [Gonium pectorale]|eukprot:KXZ42459.1 hypothetical protein GPECTOR_144g722 [Gonium pectorale]
MADWKEPHSAAFRAIKDAVCSDTVLSFPDFAKPFTVVADASLAGTGAVLLQDDRPVAFTSKKFSPAERNYTTSEQELLAIVHALKEWRCYLEGGKPFRILSDHKPLVFVDGIPTLNRRQARWMEFLSRFTYKIEHLKAT